MGMKGGRASLKAEIWLGTTRDCLTFLDWAALVAVLAGVTQDM